MESPWEVDNQQSQAALQLYNPSTKATNPISVQTQAWSHTETDLDNLLQPETKSWEISRSSNTLTKKVILETDNPLPTSLSITFAVLQVKGHEKAPPTK